jgi:hypothetical protein
MEFGQKSIYDELKRFLQDNKANLRHFNQSKLNELQDILKDENIYKNGKLPYANTLKTQIQNEFEPLLLKAKESAIKHLEEIIITLQNDKNFEKVSEKERYRVIKPIESIKTQIKNLSIIDTINALANDDSLLTKGLEKIEELMVVEDDEEVTTTQRVLLTNIMPKGKRLNNTKDVEEYLVELRKKLIKAIEDNKEILV